jgi:hypothetical protein
MKSCGPFTDTEKAGPARNLDQAMKAHGIVATVFNGDAEGNVVRLDDWRIWFYREGKLGAEPKAWR